MKLYCANCGTQLRIIRKAVPSRGIILDLVEYHECLETPADPSQVIVEAPIASGDRNKFVKSINDLSPANESSVKTFKSQERRPSSMLGTDDLRDRRFDNEKIPSTAPSSVLDQIKQMGNSIPAHDVKEDDSEMDG